LTVEQFFEIELGNFVDAHFVIFGFLDVGWDVGAESVDSGV